MAPQYDPERHHRRSIRLRGYDYRQAGAYFITIVAQGRECLFGQVVDGVMRLNEAGRMVERWWAELGNKYATVIPDLCVVMPNHFHGIVVITDTPAAPVGADLRVCPGPGADTGAGADTGQGAHAGAPLPRQSTGLAPDPGADTGAGAHAGQGAHTGEGADTGAGADMGEGAHTGEGADTGQGAHAGAPLPRQSTGAAPSIPKTVQWFKTMTTNEYIRGVKTLGWTSFPGRLWQRNYYEHIIRDDSSLNRIRQYIADNPARWAWDTYNPAAAGPDPQAADLWRLLQERIG